MQYVLTLDKITSTVIFLSLCFNFQLMYHYAKVLVLVYPLLLFRVQMCKSFFLFVCHGYEVILVPLRLHHHQFLMRVFLVVNSRFCSFGGYQKTMITAFLVETRNHRIHVNGASMMRMLLQSLLI